MIGFFRRNALAVCSSLCLTAGIGLGITTSVTENHLQPMQEQRLRGAVDGLIGVALFSGIASFARRPRRNQQTPSP